MQPPHPIAIYALLAAIGALGAVGDSLLFKAAVGPRLAKALAAGVAVWLLAVLLVYVYFRISPHGFTAAVLMMIVFHAVVTAAIDSAFFGGKIGKREVIGFLLAIAAVVVLEGGTHRPAPPAVQSGPAAE